MCRPSKKCTGQICEEYVDMDCRGLTLEMALVSVGLGAVFFEPKRRFMVLKLLVEPRCCVTGAKSKQCYS